MDLVLSLASLLFPSPAHAIPVDQSAELAADATVALQDTCGTLSVAAWDQPRLQVTGTLEEPDDLVRIAGTATRLSLSIEDRQGGDTGCADLVVRLPAGVRLEVETVSADAQVAGLRGTLDLDSVSGDVRVQGDAQQIAIETVSGEVEVEAVSAVLTVETVSGDVTLRRALGRLEAETVSGQVSVDGGPFGRIEITTVSGDLSLRGPLEPSGRMELATHSGDVTLALPLGLPATWDLRTFSGQVTGAPRATWEKGFVGSRVTWVEGAGTASVSVETHSGDVNIQAQ